jgi:DNA-binding NtrC family response regulator
MMKLALVFEKDASSSKHMQQLLQWIGYLAVPVFTAEQVLRAAKWVRFDVVSMHTCIHPNDRRSLAGELKYLSKKTIVVLATNDPAEIDAANNDPHHCVNISLRRPVLLDGLRRKLEYGIDGDGSQRQYLGPSIERRGVDAHK